MIELILLATAGYFVFRLWNALGTRTGFERTVEQPEQTKEITLESGQFRSLDGLGSDQDLPEKLELLQAKQPDFKVETFLESAKKAFHFIVNAYNDHDQETLEMLLTPSLYQAFLSSPSTRKKEVAVVEGEIQDIDVRGDRAHITVLFRSQQDNVWVVDLWTFERFLQDESPLWKLCRTAKGE